MSKTVQKSKLRKARDWVVINMLRHTKPGAHKGSKKQEEKDSCRKFKHSKEHE